MTPPPATGRSPEPSPALRALPPPAALLCDMDGTLVDTERDWLDTVAHLLNLRVEDGAVREFAGHTVADGAALLAPRLPGFTGAAVARLLDRAFTERVAAGVTVQPGALRLLDRAAALDIPVALVTASERPVADLVLDRLGRHRFVHSVASGEAGRDKPHPEPYTVAARALRTAPRDCLAVEDTPAGVTAARTAGCRVLAVPTVPGIAAGPDTLLANSLADVDFRAPSTG